MRQDTLDDHDDFDHDDYVGAVDFDYYYDAAGDDDNACDPWSRSGGSGHIYELRMAGRRGHGE